MADGDQATPRDDPGALLRLHGLRVTPQRRAIIGAFAGAPTEHLSADEAHARASAAVPDLSRGTVYATLAELTELGLLAAVGSPEPVRYETNTTDHQHFRCRICLRLYDVELPALRTDRVVQRGFLVERTTSTVEGVCADCIDYEDGLREGARASVDGGADRSALPAHLACERLTSPLGDLLLAATSQGVVRLVFDDHVDAPALRTLSKRRTGGSAARAHLVIARAFVDAYLAGEPLPVACAVDWEALDNVSTSTLRDIQAAPVGTDRSYETLRGPDARTKGLAIGTNPLVIVVPCHRVTRGREVPDAYIGGPERKRWLRQHERRA